MTCIGENPMKQQYHLFKNLYAIGATAICFLLLLVVCLFFTAGAQTQPTDTSRDEFEPKIKAFFSALERGASNQAFDDLLQGSPLNSPDANTSLRELRTKVDDLQTPCGNILASEKLEIKQIGTSTTLVRYVLMYEHYPVIWTFTFYRKPPSSTVPSTTAPPPRWTLVELHFETDMKNLLR